MADLSMTSSQGNVSDLIVKRMIQASKDLNVPPSYVITQAHYESYWGNTPVGRNNNNWGGMTFFDSWKSPLERPSGITVSRGTKRRKEEKHSYIKYKDVSDYFTDWTYLMRRGGIYKVADSSTFDNSVRGMFVYGGSKSDYAIMGTNNSKARYERYLLEMSARRKYLNKVNDGILDKLDSENIVTEEFPDNVTTIIDDIKASYNSVEIKLNDLEKKMYDKIMKLLSVNLYRYSENIHGNKYIRVEKLLDNMYLLKPNLGLTESLSKELDIEKDKVNHNHTDITGITNTDNNIIADLNGNKPTFPTPTNLKITSTYGYRGNVGEKASKNHKGIDIGGGGKVHDIYATQTGKVILSQTSSSAGEWIQIKHTDDTYYSVYMHLSKRLVNEGDSVVKGEKIGIMGNTGNSYGIHLHFGISTNGDFKNNTINPEEYLRMEFKKGESI